MHLWVYVADNQTIIGNLVYAREVNLGSYFSVKMMERYKEKKNERFTYGFYYIVKALEKILREMC